MGEFERTALREAGVVDMTQPVQISIDELEKVNKGARTDNQLSV